MADLHSDAGNESRCNCFGRPGTNPGCPAHGNHATPPAVRHQERPIDPGAGETTSGPGWDALRADRDRLDAALTNARAVASDRIADRDKLIRELMAERDAARAALATVRTVADHWRKVATRNEWVSAAHALCRVLAALDGETDPTIPPTPRE